MHASVQAKRFYVQRRPPMAKGTMIAEVVAKCDAINTPRLEEFDMRLEPALAYDPRS